MHIETIGVMHTSFISLESMPIQPKGAPDSVGTIIIEPRYVAGLADLEGFSHLYLIFHLHKANREELTVVPFMDTVTRGVYATRSPLRPNHIGLSIVELISIENNILTVKGADFLDGTPLLDIKPYIEAFDKVSESRSGWMRSTQAEVESKRSDGRFI